MDKLQNKVVLIVDDDDRNIFALESFLETLDVTIIVAKNGKEALSVLDDQLTVDLILLDMMMPVMDGFETLNKLSQNDELKHIPVIAVTAKAMKGDKEKCIKAGAWDYISKPLDLKLLVEKMNNLIKE